MTVTNRQIAPVPGDPRPLGERRVLLVAAPGHGRRRLARQLQEAGLCVVEADTPAEARLIAATCPEFIVCDWGWANEEGSAENFCARSRSPGDDEQYSYLVAIVPRNAAHSVATMLAAGADDFLLAPVAPAELTARLASGERFLAMAQRLLDSKRAMAETLARLQAVQAATDADLAEARRLQQGLVGARNARFGQVEVSLLLRSAGHVGGDLVGYFPINARRVAFYALDVSGNGVAAALLTARLAAHLSGLAGENVALRLDENDLYDARSPAEVAGLFNRLMLEEVVTETYFTMIYVDLDVTTGTGRLVQAGHPHPLLQAADGSVTVLGEGGMPIGLMPDASWEEVSFHLPPGARLFISSDGITEAENPSGAQLAEEGLIAILRTNAFLGGAPLLESLCWSIAQFSQGVSMDDVSAVLIERDKPLLGV